VVQPETHKKHLRNPGMGLIMYDITTPPPDIANIYYKTIVW